MFVRDLKECDEFVAGDRTILRELLHPEKADLDLRYSLAHAVLKRGDASLKHRLSVSEVYYILEGEGVMHVGEESREVRRGQAIYIPPHAVQWIQNTGPTYLKFLCLVDPAWREEHEEII